MAELKTKLNDQDVDKFIDLIQDEKRKSDCKKVLGMMRELSGEEGNMWGDSIVGFGTYQYQYPNGKSMNWFSVGFSPRKQALTLYLMAGFNRFPDEMEKLGKYKTGKSCLYVKNLSDIDEQVFRSLIKKSLDHFKK